MVSQTAHSLMSCAYKDKIEKIQAPLYPRKNSMKKYSAHTEKSQSKRLKNSSPKKQNIENRHNVTPMTNLTAGSSENGDMSGLLQSNCLLSSPCTEDKNLDKKRKKIGLSRRRSSNRLSKYGLESSKDKPIEEFLKLSKVRNEFPVLFSPEQSASHLVTLNRKMSELGIRASPNTGDIEKMHNNAVLESTVTPYIEASISPQSDNLVCKRSMIQRLCGRGDQSYGVQVHAAEDKFSQKTNQENIAEQSNDDILPIPELADSFMIGLDKYEDSIIDNKMSFLMKSINDSTIIADSNNFSRRDSIGADILKDL